MDVELAEVRYRRCDHGRIPSLTFLNQRMRMRRGGGEESDFIPSITDWIGQICAG